MNDQTKITGEVTIKHIRNGKVLSETTTKNTITNVSFAVLSGLAGNVGSQVAFTYLAVGTSATATSAGHTALQAEITTLGLARVAATVTRSTTTQTNDTLQLDYTWTASGTVAVEEIGIFNNTVASGTSIMLARALTTTKSLTNLDVLVATYKVKFS